MNKIYAVGISVILYLIFFFPLLNQKYFFWGSDAQIKHYPVREYLYRSVVKEHHIPLWTERVFFGYALYTDIENAYLNPINLLSIIFLGPVLSFKLIHFLSIIIGCVSLYVLLSRKNVGLVLYTCSCLIYYYSFFHINHTIHFNLIAISLLLPLNILLADNFLLSQKFKFVIFQSLLLAYGILWGHPQTTILVLIAISLYIFILGQNIALKNKILYLVKIFLISVLLSLPQLISTFRVYINSHRDSAGVNYYQGTLTPELSISYIFPYIFSTFPYYYGEDVLEELSYTETYAYIGICAFILGLMCLLYGKKDRYFWFCFTLILVFLFLGYLRGIPFINSHKIFIFSSFRYWNRSIFLLSFGLSLLIPKVLAEKFTRSSKKDYIVFLVPILWMILLSLINFHDSTFTLVRDSLLHFKSELFLKRDIILWILLSLSCAFLFIAQFTKYKKIAQYVLVLMLLFDYRYFAKDVLAYRIKKWRRESGLTYPNYWDGVRILDESMLVDGMLPLFKKAFTPYGYSQFVDENYYDFYRKYDLGKSLRTSYENGEIRENLNLSEIKDFGIKFIKVGSGERELRDQFYSTYLKDKIPFRELITKEGHVKLEVQNDKQEVFTTIKYDKNWFVMVDGKKVEPKIWADIFIQINVAPGTHVLEFRYIPYDVYAGFGVQAVFLSLFLVINKINKREPKEINVPK